MSGEATPSQIGAFLMALGCAAKPSTKSRAPSRPCAARCCGSKRPTGAIDIVGTGGDGSHSVNISTASAFVDRRRRRSSRQARQSRPVLADRRRRCPDGARRQASTLPPEPIGRCIAEAGVGFMFAPGASSRHAAMSGRPASSSAPARSSTCSDRCQTRPG